MDIDGINRVQAWIQSLQPSTPKSPNQQIREIADEPPKKRARRNDLANGFLHDPYNAAFPDSPPETPWRFNSDVTSTVPSTDDTSDMPPAKRLEKPSDKPNTKKAKKVAELKELSPPIEFKMLGSYVDAVKVLPEDVQTLYKDIRKAANRRVNIVPVEVKAEIEKKELDCASHLREPDATDGASEAAKQIHHRLIKIIRAACTCTELEQHEASWHSHVHQPLIELVFPWQPPDTSDVSDQSQPQLKVNALSTNVTTAKIEDDSIPRYSDGTVVAVDKRQGSQAGTSTCSSLSDSQTRTNNTRVDFVVYMDLAESDPLKKEIDRVTRACKNPRASFPHVNQTEYHELLLRPIAVSLEMKTQGDKGLIQLGIWGGAWYINMYRLRNFLGDDTTERLVSTVFIQVVGHDWKVYFAVDERVADKHRRLRMYGPMEMGSSRTILEIYALLTSLQAIKKWIESSFYAGMKKWFKIDNGVSTPSAGL